MERLLWRPDEPENEPVVNLVVNGESEYELNRLNTTLFTFMGRLAVYNHIFYHDIHEEENPENFYIFSYQQGYPEIVRYMAENDFTMVLNQTEVSVTDQEAYMRSVTRGMGDTIPEEWLNNG